MFGSSVLDVAVGAIFVFLLLSVFATAIHELIFSFLNMRGRALMRGIGNLLDDTHATGLVKNIYNHGQVYGLFEGQFNPKKPGKLPSYIPARNFAQALLGTIADTITVARKIAPAGGAAAQEVAVITDEFKQAVEALAKKNEKVGKPLLAMVHMAGNDAAKLQKSVEDWFNSGMDRVSGWYKYRTQWMLFYIGLCIACLLNVSTVRLVTQLSQDATLRASLVAAAESAKAPEAQKQEGTEAKIAATQKAFASMTSLGVPLGWHDGDAALFQHDHYYGAGTIVGWLMTAVAISLGAPFWFDILNKIMVVRSTVKPREKSHDEGSKD